MNALFDTSLLVALEQGFQLADPPEHAALSVLTLAELRRGALLASDLRTRSARTEFVVQVERIFEAVPVDRAVALVYAELSAERKRLERRPHVIDGLIAATAIVHDVPLYTRDEGFERIPQVRVVRV